MAKTIRSEEITLGTGADPARFVFGVLKEPKKFNAASKQARFEGTILLDPSVAAHKANLDACRAAITKLVAEAYGKDVSVAGLLEDNRIALVNNTRSDGSQRKSGKSYEAYKGMYFLPANKSLMKDEQKELDAFKSRPDFLMPAVQQQYTNFLNTLRPTIRSRSGELIFPGHEQWPVSGSYTRAKISFWAQPPGSEWGMRVNCNLLGLQYVKYGEPTGESGGGQKEVEFEALEDGPEAPAGGVKEVSGW